jgi:hypothetical protein
VPLIVLVAVGVLFYVLGTPTRAHRAAPDQVTSADKHG